MQVSVLRAKLHDATITEANLYYEGSITIDQDLLDAAGMLANERVLVVNLNNGSRLETFTIVGARGSGVICMNGPAARLCQVGDKIHIIAYGIVELDEAGAVEPCIVKLDERNRPR